MPQIINLFNAYGVYFFLGLLIADIVLIVWVFVLRKNFKKIFKSGSLDLEKILLELKENQGMVGGKFNDLDSRVKVLEEALPKDLRKVGLVRFNPFSDAGGDQSFVLALLNDHRDGVVVTSLYGREVNRIYAKPIQNGASTYQLTAEEKTAIENAK